MPIANLRAITRYANRAFRRSAPHCGAATAKYKVPSVDESGSTPPAGTVVERYEADDDEALAEEIKRYAIDNECDWKTAKAAVMDARSAGRETEYASYSRQRIAEREPDLYEAQRAEAVAMRRRTHELVHREAYQRAIRHRDKHPNASWEECKAAAGIPRFIP